MAISDYIATLKKTKTFKDGLISYQEYSKEPKWGGLWTTLPEFPHADDDRHVVVMEVPGNQPVIYTVLSKQTHSVNITSRNAGHLLFIFIEMRPQTIRVQTPSEGYHLADGHRIDATFTMRYQVEDAESFWKGGTDQLAELETAVTDAAQNFFLNIRSNELINSPAELKHSLEQHIKQSDIIIIKSNLEESISKDFEVAGIKLIRVKADVTLSDSLKEHLARIHYRLYGEGGLADRSKIDQLINIDKTYSPFGLRQVIMALDIRLLENFYVMNWSESMRKVTARLAERKEQDQRSVEDTEISNMKKRIDAAVSNDLDEMDVIDLNGKFSKKLLEFADRTGSAQLPSDSQYLDRILGPSSSTGLPRSDVAPEVSTLGDCERFLLDSPEMTDEEYQAIEEKRRHFNQWK